jgi:ParB-like chromosome segregation protein Spo0J
MMWGKRGKMAKSVQSQVIEAAAEWVAVDSLKPWPGNPRKNAEAVAKVARSIKRFGFGSPIVARREDREVISGHTRLLAARRLGMAEVPVRWLDLDAESAHKMAVADNRLAEEANWDRDALAGLLSDWEHDTDLAALGFEEAEIAKLIEGAGTAGEIEELDVSELEATFWLSVEGPIGQQPEVLERLKEALQGLPGVDVSLSTTGL